MKLTCFLLACYIIMVSFYPCTDSDNVTLNASIIEISHTDHDHSNQDERHTCPPFCVCNCCGVQLLNYTSVITFEFHTPIHSIPLKKSFYVSNLSDTYSGSIWQPPQLLS